MGRLFYESSALKEQAREEGELEISRSGKSSESQPVKPEDSKLNSHLDKVSKLIPSEIIAGYLAMFGFVPLVQNKALQSGVLWVIFGLCLIVTPIYLNRQAEKNKPKRNHLIISTIAFIVWAYATTGSTLVTDFYDAAIGSIVLVAFSLISAAIPLDK